MRFDPYARREFEPYRAWAERLLTCPILGPEMYSTIAEVSGADEMSLRMYAEKMRTEMGWEKPKPMHMAKPRTALEIDEAFAALTSQQMECEDDELY